MAYKPYQGKRKGRSRFKENPWVGTLRNVLGNLVSQGAQFGLGQLGKSLDQPRQDEIMNTKLEQQRLDQEAADARSQVAVDARSQAAAARETAEQRRHAQIMEAMKQRGSGMSGLAGSKNLGQLARFLAKGGESSGRLAGQILSDPKALGAGEPDISGPSVTSDVSVDPVETYGFEAGEMGLPGASGTEYLQKQGRAQAPEETAKRVSSAFSKIPDEEIRTATMTAGERGEPGKFARQTRSIDAASERQERGAKAGIIKGQAKAKAGDPWNVSGGAASRAYQEALSKIDQLFGDSESKQKMSAGWKKVYKSLVDKKGHEAAKDAADRYVSGR